MTDVTFHQLPRERSVGDSPQGLPFCPCSRSPESVCPTTAENASRLLAGKKLSRDLATVETALRARGAISGRGAAGSDSENTARRRPFRNHTVPTGLSHCSWQFTANGFTQPQCVFVCVAGEKKEEVLGKKK